MSAPKGNTFASNKGVAPLMRFASKCAFDPITGCVHWVGGKTTGGGHNQYYGAFWFEGKRWFAHRWAAKYIHGHNIDGMHVDHNCPCGGTPTCVQHVTPETAKANRQLQNTRPGRTNFQSKETLKYWAFVTKGLEPSHLKKVKRKDYGRPYFDPPAWLAPYLENENG